MSTHYKTGPGAKPQKKPPAGAPFTRSIPSNSFEAQALVGEALLHFREAKSAGLARDVEEYFFRLALDETLTNAVKHGNRGDAAKEITLTVNFTKHGAKVTVCDEGGGFCVEQVPDPRSAERKYRKGGRGVWILNAVGSVVCRGACVEVRL
ncbi:MAG: ATP-binding protein [Spirochaetes bacterium]|nr:ATP-binding protein [Spirochaetota bacterium]